MKRLMLLVLCIVAQTLCIAENVLETAPILKLLPARTSGVVLINNLDHATDCLGKQQIIEQYQEEYNAIVAEVTKHTGVNFLSAEGLRQVGVDPTKPAGVAFIDIPKENLAFLATLSDSKKLKDTIESLCQQHNMPLFRQKVGEVELIRFEEQLPEVIFVVHENHLIISLADAPQHRETAIDVAVEIASVTPQNSLAGTELFQATAKGLGFGKDIAAYFNPKSLIELFGMPGEEFYGKNPSVALGIELEKNSLQFKSYCHLGQESLVLQFLKNRHQPYLLSCLENPMLSFFSAAIDTEKLINWMAMQGEIPFPKEMEAMLQMTMTEILALFGNVNIAISGNLDVAKFSENINQMLDVSLASHITNPEKITMVLENLCNNPEFPFLTKNPQISGFTLDLQEWKKVYISITGERLLVSSNLTTLKKLQKTDLQSPAYGLSQLQDASVVFAVDAKVLAYTLIASESHSFWAASEPGETASLSGPEQSVEYTEEELQRKLELESKLQENRQRISELSSIMEAQREEISQQIEEIRKQKDEEVSLGMLKVIDRFGSLVIKIQKKSDGLVLRGGIFCRDNSLASLAKNTAQDVLNIQQREAELYNKIYDFQEKISELENKFYEQKQLIEEENESLEKQLQDLKNNAMKK